MTVPFENSPPRLKRGSTRRKGLNSERVGVALIGKDVEWNFFPDDEAFRTPVSTNVDEWKNPCCISEPWTPEEEPSRQTLICSQTSRRAERGLCGCALRPIPGEMRSGQAWTVAICALMGCRDVVGIIASLSLMGNVVENMPQSELVHTGADFEREIREKREVLPHIFVSSGEQNSLEAFKAKYQPTIWLRMLLIQEYWYRCSGVDTSVRRDILWSRRGGIPTAASKYQYSYVSPMKN